MKKQLIGEIIRFGITGGLGAVTNLLIFFICADFFHLPPTPVSIACFIIAGTQNYFLNHLWSFKQYTAGTPVSFKKWLAFFAGALLGLIINLAVMNFIIAHYNLPYKFIAQAFGIASGMVINFIISKMVIFRKKEKNE